MSVIYLNGKFVPSPCAKISVMDRGFLFGDSLYEVIPFYKGKPLGLANHLKRLSASLQSVYISPPLNFSEWREILSSLIEKNSQSDKNCSAYLQVSRGEQENREHTLPKNITPTVLAFLVTHTPPNTLETLTTGFSAISVTDTRSPLCHIKTTSLMQNILLRNKATESQADEAILVREGYAVEGSSSNLFIVDTEKTVITPPIAPYILNGVTREIVLEICAKNSIQTSEHPITLNALKTAQEIWLTGSSKAILPITQLNHTAVGAGTPGPMWKKVMTLYQSGLF